ncbi:tetratricopeptide repeat protein [Flavisolibacter nicotianae]|uniref:tetratricopeptide repeat protein n=1 Tax=Flavisolibacter nicotianae TaxID=2364882 RepID=UPI000EB06879|nr:tetratricopeptide repeat protein [Flavisolibacter nicotianae]
MRRAWLAVGLWLLACTVHSQNPERDSLRSLLRLSQDDTLRILRQIQLSGTYAGSAPDTMLLMASEAVSQSRKIGFKKGEGFGLNAMANAYSTMESPAKALELYLQSLLVSENINDRQMMEKVYNNIGVIHSNQQGEERQGLQYYFQAKAMAEQLHNQRSLSIVLVNMGEAYKNLRMYDSAIIYTQQAYKLAVKLGGIANTGVPMLVMGEIYLAMGKPAAAQDYLKKAAILSKQAGDYRFLSQQYVDLAKSFNSLNQPDSGMHYAKMALSIAKEKQFLGSAAAASELLYNLYKRKVDADSALTYLELTRSLNDSLKSEASTKKLQALSMEESLRQQEKLREEERAREERLHNIQYAAIAVGLFSFLIVFFIVSLTVVVNQKLIKLLGIVALLILFEFINLLIHPYLGGLTHHSPFWMLLIMVCIAALLVPMHHRIEHWVTHKLTVKNNKIRMAAAARKSRAQKQQEAKLATGKGTGAQQQL